MNRFASILAILLAFGAVLISLSACSNGSSDLSNMLYITQAKFTNSAEVVMADGIGNYNLSVSSIYLTDKNVNVEVEVLSESSLNEYNDKYKTTYEYVPKEAVKFSSNNVTISQNMAISGDVTITVSKWDGYRDGAEYAIPVGINSAGSDMPVIEGSDYLLLELSEKIVSNAVQIGSNGFVPVEQKSIFAPEKEMGDAYGTITIEGKFRETTGYYVPGNWRADIFNGFGLQIITSPNGTMNVRFPDSSFLGAFGTVSLKKWHHFAIVNDNGTVSAYFDGEPQLTAFNGSNFTIGNFGIANYCRGTGIALDEFRIWKTARTARQIKKYPNIVDASNPDLLVYYRFNEDSGTIAKDETGNCDLKVNNNGTVEWITGVTYP